MQKKNCNRLLKERTSKIQKISHKINYDDLSYYFKGPDISLIDYNDYKDC